jgi:hypothetical protein
MSIVFAVFHHFRHVVEQRWRLKLAVGFFTQVENRQTGGEILVIRRLAGDKVRGGFDNGFVNVGGFDAVIELNVGTQFYLEMDTLFSPSAAQSSTRWILSRLMRSVLPSRFVTSRL